MLKTDTIPTGIRDEAIMKKLFLLRPCLPLYRFTSSFVDQHLASHPTPALLLMLGIYMFTSTPCIER